MIFQWNGTTIYNFESQRDFGTDYGICCWYTPQFNFSQILEQSQEMGLLEPDWGYWFTSIKKVTCTLYSHTKYQRKHLYGLQTQILALSSGRMIKVL